MRKAKLNFVVDALAFVAFAFLTATGVLVRYVLPPGSGHFSTVWGMDRHEWGHVHFWIAVVLSAALGFHLFLHWRWIVCMVQGRPREGSGVRVALALVGVMAFVGLTAAPFFGRVEQAGEPPHRMRATESSESPVPEVVGSMTLNDLERVTGVPATVILRELGLPQHVLTDARLGRLRQEHGFELHDVREIVRRHLEER